MASLISSESPREAIYAAGAGVLPRMNGTPCTRDLSVRMSGGRARELRAYEPPCLYRRVNAAGNERRIVRRRIDLPLIDRSAVGGSTRHSLARGDNEGWIRAWISITLINSDTGTALASRNSRANS
jgi:hypothetical protein